MSFFKNLIDETLLKRVEDEFFHPYDKFIGVNRKCSGDTNAIIDNRLMLLTWAGPHAEVDNTFHEMSHLLEIDEDRCHLPNWGLKIPPLKSFGGHVYRDAMETPQAIEREIRVCGIQYVLGEHYNIQINNDDSDRYSSREHRLAAPLVFIDGLHHFYPDDWRDEKRGYNYNENYAVAKMASMIVDEAKKWTMDKIRELWHHRMQVIRERWSQNCYEGYFTYEKKAAKKAVKRG